MFRTVPKRGRAQTRLYRAWRNMKSRVKGSSTKSPWIYEGLPFAFPVFVCFRCYAIVYGFSKSTSSPERVIPDLGYVPGNVRFLSVAANSATSRGRAWSSLSDYDVRGPEPPLEDYEVPF